MSKKKLIIIVAVVLLVAGTVLYFTLRKKKITPTIQYLPPADTGTSLPSNIGITTSGSGGSGSASSGTTTGPPPAPSPAPTVQVGDNVVAKKDTAVYNTDWSVYRQAQTGDFIGGVLEDRTSVYYVLTASGNKVFVFKDSVKKA